MLDGIDLGPALRGESTPERSAPMVWDFHGYGGIAAIRDGRWKAVRRDLRRKNPKAWELYDLETDRAESNDLATKYPEIVARLEAAYAAARTANEVFPLPLYDGRSTHSTSSPSSR